MGTDFWRGGVSSESGFTERGSTGRRCAIQRWQAKPKALWAVGGSPAALHSPGHVGDHRGEVGGAVELHGAQAAVVSLQDAIDATA